MLEKSYFTCHNIFVRASDSYRLPIFFNCRSLVRLLVFYGLQFPSYRGPRLFRSIVNRETPLEKEREKEKEREN